MTHEIVSTSHEKNGSILKHAKHRRDHGRCPPVPHFDRLCYFYGQLLGAGDFRTEQAYFREKMKLHNRCLHGHGVVCGLEVRPKPSLGRPEPPSEARPERPSSEDSENKVAECKRRIEELKVQIEELREKLGADELDPESRRPLMRKLEEALVLLGRTQCECERLQHEPPEETTGDDQAPRCPAILIIEPGLALDCGGNELVVREPLCINPLQHLSDDDRQRVLDPSFEDDMTLYVRLCYKDLPLEPARPALPEECGVTQTCRYGKVRDSLCVRVTLEQPDEDPCCDCCCGECCDDCVLIARIDHFRPYRPIRVQDVRNEYRRHLATYATTRIEAISWVHGASYSELAVRDLIDRGLEIRFTRPVQRRSLHPGVIDVMVFEGGYTRAGQMVHLAGEIEADPLPHDPECTLAVRYNFGKHERLSPADRLHIIVRTAFIMDRCCRAVDGEHIGGWVPQIIYGDDRKLPEPEARPPLVCTEQHWRTHRRLSGNGAPGGNFESWLYVSTEQRGTR